MKFTEENKDQIVQFRCTASELAWLKERAAAHETTTSGVLRIALDHYAAQFAEGPAGRSGSKVSGSRGTPSGETAKVSAPSKRSPSKSKGRVQ